MPTKASEFPRGNGVPPQSAAFWTANKDRYLRQLLIEDIEQVTKRDLVVLFHAPGTNGQVSSDDARYLVDMLSKPAYAEFDLMIETPGGIVDDAETVCALLKNTGRAYRVIVPAAAKSAGTTIALSASSIVMGHVSELGPIDPSLGRFPTEFLEDLSDEQKKFIAELGNDPLTGLDVLHLFWNGSQSQKQMKQLATKVLKTGMLCDSSDDDIGKVVNSLATRDIYASHGSTVDASEALKLGLKVERLDPNNDLWQRLWLLWNMYSYDCDLHGYDKMFESRFASHSVIYPKCD